MSRLERSDSDIINGQWHYCPACKTHWSDSDGSCECVICDTCYNPFDPDKDKQHTKTQKQLGKTLFIQTIYKCGDCVQQEAFELAEEMGI